LLTKIIACLAKNCNILLNGIMEEEFEDTKWGNQNLYIEEEQITQQSTKHTHTTNDQVTRTIQNTGCLTTGFVTRLTRRVSLVEQ
jgi:hypothetical protein